MLFELMLVILIFFSCSAIGLFYYNTTKKISFAQDVALLSLLFHTAATRALCLKKEQIIIFDPSEHVCLFDGQRIPLSPEYRFGTVQEVYGPPGAPQKLIRDPITFVNHTLVAAPDGTMQAGTLYIKNGDNQYAITTPVSACSYVRAYHYRDMKWQRYY